MGMNNGDGLTVGVEGEGVEETNGKKGGTSVTEQQ